MSLPQILSVYTFVINVIAEFGATQAKNFSAF